MNKLQMWTNCEAFKGSHVCDLIALLMFVKYDLGTAGITERMLCRVI